MNGRKNKQHLTAMQTNHHRPQSQAGIICENIGTKNYTAAAAVYARWGTTTTTAAAHERRIHHALTNEAFMMACSMHEQHTRSGTPAEKHKRMTIDYDRMTHSTSAHRTLS